MTNIAVKIEIGDNIAGYLFEDEQGNKLIWEDLTRQDQIKICNSFVSGYELWSKFIKDA